MSQPLRSLARLGLGAGRVPTRGGLSWRAAATSLAIGARAPFPAARRATGTWGVGSPPRRLVDLLQVEPGYRIGFLDDPAGRGAQLAGELLSRQRRVFLYGVSIGAGLRLPRFNNDGCFDLVVSVGDRKHWTMVSRALADVNRLVVPGGTIAVITPHSLSVLGRGMRRFPTAVWSAVSSSGSFGSYGSASADPRDAQDIAVGKRLVELFGAAVRTELGSRVVWQATRHVSR